MPPRQQLIAVLFSALAALCGLQILDAHAQSTPPFPSRDVRIIVPQPPGSVADQLARRFAERLAGTWKHDVSIDNRPGAARLLPVELTARPTNDGHVLLLVTAELFELRPDAAGVASTSVARAIQPVMLLARAPLVLTSDRDGKVDSLETLRRLAAARPGTLTLRTGPDGSLERLIARHLARNVSVTLDARPRRELPGFVDAAVDLELATLPALMAAINAGTARPLVLLGSQRAPILRELPVAAERGFAELAVDQWFGITAAVGLPGARLIKLHQDLALTLASQDVHDALIDEGFAPVGSSPAEFATLLLREEARLHRLARALVAK